MPRITRQVDGVLADGFVEIAPSVFEFPIPVIVLAFVKHFFKAGVTHSKFPKKTGMVSGLLHLKRIGLLNIFLFDLPLAEGIAVGSFVHASEDTGPAGSTDRRRDKGIFKIHPFPRQLVHLRRLDQSIAGIAQSIPSLVIRQDKDDIGRAALGLSRKLESKQYQEYAQDVHFHFIISYNENQFCH